MGDMVNGEKVYSVRDVVNMIETAKPDDFIRLEGDSLLIIKKSAATAAEMEIRKRYKIEELKSSDLYLPDFGATCRQYYRELYALADKLFDLDDDLSDLDSEKKEDKE